MIRIAVLDDYHRLALRLADWSAIRARAEVVVFDRNLALVEEAAAALADFDVICTLRERMAVPAALLERLPRLKLIAITGDKHRTLDLAAATARGIVVSCTTAKTRGTSELAWALILALARQIPAEVASMRRGGWQSPDRIGLVLSERTLGLVGLGRIGQQVAAIGRAFGMETIAWSPNLTDARAAEAGVRRVDKDALFRDSDVISIHLVLGETTRGLIGARELGLMRPSAFLVNTARGPIVDEAALVEALRGRRIAGAGLDVFDREPLPDDHPLRSLDNALLTPHLGYLTEDTLRLFYGDTVDNLAAWLAGTPIRVLNPDALGTGTLLSPSLPAGGRGLG